MHLMRRNRIILLFGLLCLTSVVSAEDSIVHTNVLKLKFGGCYQMDTYLSPFAYTGLQGGLCNGWWQPFRQDTRLGRTGRLANWAHVGRVDIRLGRQTSAARSNRISGFAIEGGWGAFYRWRWIDNRLQLLAGPYLEAGLGVRNIASNVNKPYSFDLSAEVMAMAGLSWSFYGTKTSYRLHYLVRTNLIGFDYMPDYWQSYYEITEGVPGMARCSGHWNHHTLKHELALDFQFPHSTWRLGAEHEYVRYGTADLHFVRNQISLVVGCIWNYHIKANTRL